MGWSVTPLGFEPGTSGVQNVRLTAYSNFYSYWLVLCFLGGVKSEQSVDRQNGLRSTDNKSQTPAGLQTESERANQQEERRDREREVATENGKTQHCGVHHPYPALPDSERRKVHIADYICHSSSENLRIKI